MAADDVQKEDHAAAISAFLRKARARTGDEAFAGTTWSVLLQMNEGGSTIFTVQLLDDFSCRFSDSELQGGWECEKDFVVIEKPKAFFQQTLFLSARLQPPGENQCDLASPSSLAIPAA